MHLEEQRDNKNKTKQKRKGDEEELVYTESGGRSVEEMKNYLQDKIKLILDHKKTKTRHVPEPALLQHPRHSNAKYSQFLFTNRPLQQI